MKLECCVCFKVDAYVEPVNVEIHYFGVCTLCQAEMFTGDDQLDLFQPDEEVQP